MSDDFDPFDAARAGRVEVSVSRVQTMDDENPDEVTTVLLDGLKMPVEGVDLSRLARPEGADYLVPFTAVRETRVHSWGAEGVFEQVTMHVSEVLEDAAILRSLDFLIAKYVRRHQEFEPLTLESARSTALLEVLKRNGSLSRADLAVVSEKENEGGVFHFEIESSEWVFSLRVERRQYLAIVTRLKRSRRLSDPSAKRESST